MGTSQPSFIPSSTGFALRGRVGNNNDGENNGLWSGWRSNAPQPTFATAAEADAYWKLQSTPSNSTMMGSMIPAPGLTEEEANALVADATTEWLSFFLMTIGKYLAVGHCPILIALLRLVYSSYLHTRFLAGQALGARDLRLSADHFYSRSWPTTPSRRLCLAIRANVRLAWDFPY